MVKDTNVTIAPWAGDETVGSQYQEYSRELRFFKPVNLPGLASTRGVKYQVRCSYILMCISVCE